MSLGVPIFLGSLQGSLGKVASKALRCALPSGTGQSQLYSIISMHG